LEDRSTEFDKLRLLQMRDAKENSALKNRLQELKEANELEKKQLESQVSTVIHSQAGHIAAQRQKITMLQSALQDELTMSQNRIAEQVTVQYYRVAFSVFAHRTCALSVVRRKKLSGSSKPWTSLCKFL
jgi:hypothetical protein